MTKEMLNGRRILVVEDEYLLANDLSKMFADSGAEVLGPVPSVDQAMALIEAPGQIDIAVLDINLRGEMVFPVARLLQEHGIPFAFVTGYDAWALPQQFAACARLDKPLKMGALIAILGPLLTSDSPSSAS